MRPSSVAINLRNARPVASNVFAKCIDGYVGDGYNGISSHSSPPGPSTDTQPTHKPYDDVLRPSWKAAEWSGVRAMH